MKEYCGKLAVITGAASGIGRAIAEHCARSQMSVVLADIDSPGLAQFAEALGLLGVECLPVTTDVSDPEAVENLAEACFDRFGRVDLLFNNAGILMAGHCWSHSHEEWQRILNVNFIGTVNGVRSFVPRILEQGGEAHIVNTGSIASLLPSPLLGAYMASKMAVRGLTETLRQELLELDPSIGVSLLCPGPIDTAMTQAARTETLDQETREEMLDKLTPEQGLEYMAPEKCAQIVFDAIARKDFWIFTHPEYKSHISNSYAELLA